MYIVENFLLKDNSKNIKLYYFILERADGTPPPPSLSDATFKLNMLSYQPGNIVSIHLVTKHQRHCTLTNCCPYVESYRLFPRDNCYLKFGICKKFVGEIEMKSTNIACFF